jgi:hypothetical protein
MKSKASSARADEEDTAMRDLVVVNHDHQSKTKVFISYSRKDINFADRLDAALGARGFEPLIDRTDIYAFEEWWKTGEGADRISSMRTVPYFRVSLLGCTSPTPLPCK